MTRLEIAEMFAREASRRLPAALREAAAGCSLQSGAAPQDEARVAAAMEKASRAIARWEKWLGIWDEESGSSAAHLAPAERPARHTPREPASQGERYIAAA